MEGSDLGQRLTEAAPWLENLATEFLQPWRLIQIAVTAVLAAAAWGLSGR